MTQQTRNNLTLSNELVQLTGVLKRIVFTNATNGYSVCILDLAHKEGLVTITGSFSGVQCGETLKVHGAWITHPTFGKQFKCTSFETTLPADVHGIRQYLSSGLIHGIGQEYANKIVEYFGTETLHVLNEASARLTEVPGIGKKRATMIKKAWDTQQDVRDTMIFLQAYGITNTQCLRLYQKYGDKTKDVITQNPYILIDTIDGIGFKSADKIALNLGLTVDSPFRIDAGIDYMISQAEGEGNTGVIETELIQETAKLLDLQSTLISQRIPILIDQQIITLYPPLQLIQHNRLAAHEASIAKHIERLYNQPSTLPPIKVDSALQWSEAKLGITWSDTQKKALQAILKSKLAVLTGGPGTGKTTLLRALVSILTAKHVRIGLCAPTGRAAQRMNETTGWTAQTVHRLLKYEPTIGRFTYDEDNLLPVDFLIIDETSMLDAPLTHALLRALPSSAHIVCVGDIYQLPSVGAGNVLHDFIKSPYFHTEYLSDIFRQGQDSSIVSVAHDVLEGKQKINAPTLLPGSSIPPTCDVYFLPIEDPAEGMRAIQHLCWESIPKWYGLDGVQDTQILVPMHRGAIGIDQFNATFQEHAGLQRRKITVGAQKFFVGDKVIQVKNDYNHGIFNGDLGIIQDIDMAKHALTIQFNDESHTLEGSACSNLKLAYAISIHKSQGSEFPIVILPLFMQHFVMLKRNLLYTAITRGRKKVFLVGEERAYACAARTLDSTIRHTTLQMRLQHLFQKTTKT